jgi:hypothetical protein
VPSPRPDAPPVTMNTLPAMSMRIPWEDEEGCDGVDVNVNVNTDYRP